MVLWLSSTTTGTTTPILLGLLLLLSWGDPNSCVFSTFYCSRTNLELVSYLLFFSTCRCLLLTSEDNSRSASKKKKKKRKQKGWCLPLKEDEWIIPETLCLFYLMAMGSTKARFSSSSSSQSLVFLSFDEGPTLAGPERVPWEREYGVVYNTVGVCCSRGRLLVATYLFFAYSSFLTYTPLL
jgi:hypothetical protein